MRILFLVLLSFLLNYKIAYSAVSYTNKMLVEVSPVEEHHIKKQKIRRKYKQKPNKINSPRIGKIYMIIGIVTASVALLAALLLLLLISPLAWVVFLIPAVFFISGVSMILSGAVHQGRNKDWDIDYR